METTSLPRLGTYTDRLQREKAAAHFLDHAITLATDRALGVTTKTIVPAISQHNTSSLQDAGVAFAALVARESLIGKWPAP